MSTDTTFVVSPDGTTTDSPSVGAATAPAGAGTVAPVGDKADLALKVATLKVLFDRWALLDREVRDELHALTVRGERLPAVLPGTAEAVAWVTRTKPAKTKAAPKVTDPAAFVAWVAEHRPDEVVQAPAPPPEVRSSYATFVLKALVDNGGVVDTGTGELVVPDGVTWVEPKAAASNLQVRLEAGGATAIEAAWADGTLVLALPGGAS